MINENEIIDGFNWWQMLTNLGALVVLALMPYLAWIILLILK